jgi:hypothetical protein
VDNSKMAKAGTTIKFDLFKEDYGQDQMSRRVKQHCGNHCYHEDCNCEESLDDVLNPQKKDSGCCPVYR